MKYGKHYSSRKTPQSEPIPGEEQVENSAGGFAFPVDDWVRLDRFLILGSEGGSYYASEQELSLENARTVRKCIDSDGVRTVKRIVEISESGRAPKNEPAIFALALAAGTGSSETRKLAFESLSRVCRIGTHLFRFLDEVKEFRGWGRGLRRAVGDWYNTRKAEDLAYQVLKYRQRGGWSHRDALRLASPKPVDSAHAGLFRWICDPSNLGEREVPRGKKDDPVVSRYSPVVKEDIPALVWDFEEIQKAEKLGEVLKVLRKNPGISWEMIPTEFLGHADTWRELLPRLPMTALVRNLGRMTANGLLKPLSPEIEVVVGRLTEDAVKRSRLHPVAILSALCAYRAGVGTRGDLKWEPVPRISDVLEEVFYHSFANVPPIGKRLLLAIDVSASMGVGYVAGVMGLTPRMAAGAMSMVTARVEKDYHIMGFSHEFRDLRISKTDSLDKVMEKCNDPQFGDTDCAIPMIWSLENRVPVDGFVVYTDSETWFGDIHPKQALSEYRRKMGIPARMAVVAMFANRFSIADPNDGGMMDVVGFDTAAPGVISDFISG